MTDEVKAGILTSLWAVAVFIGGEVADSNKLAGGIIAIGATLALIGILYGSWMLEQREKREQRTRKIYADAIGRMDDHYHGRAE